MERRMRGTLEKVEVREPVVFDNGGEQIFAVLHRPVEVANPPLVLFLHGFASSKHGSNRCYVTLAESLAAEGIASLRFDFRGCGDSEGTLSTISLEDLVSDALTVLDGVEKIDGIDCERIGLFGASLGGAIAVIAAARFQRVKAMGLWAPVASGELWYRDFLMRHPEYLHADPSQVLSSYRGIRLSEAFRQEFRHMQAYKVIEQLDQVPILLMHGENDETVSIAHYEAFKEACLTSGIDGRFIKYPESEHSLGFSPHFPVVVEETKLWFETHL